MARKSNRAILLAAAYLLAGATFYSTAEHPLLPFADARTSINARSASLGSVLNQIATDTHVPIVFETKLERISMESPVHFTDFTITQALNDLASVYPGYVWEESPDGFLVYPRDGNILLKTKLARFDAEDVDVFGARQNLML